MNNSPRKPLLAAAALAVVLSITMAATAGTSVQSGATPASDRAAKVSQLKTDLACDFRAGAHGGMVPRSCAQELASPVLHSRDALHGPHAKIVGGTTTPTAKGPTYLVRLVSPADGDHAFCSGTLVAPLLVLTAAHCATDCYGPGPDDAFFSESEPSGINIIAGTQVSGSGGTRYKVADVIANPEYNCWTLAGDLAFLVLAKPAKGPFASLIGPGTASLLGDDTAFRVFGWGVTGTAATPVRLRQADLSFLDQAACQAAIDIWAAEEYEAAPGEVAVTDNMLCMTHPTAGTCHGDSGGPLFAIPDTSQPLNLVQVGVVSWGPGNGETCLVNSADVFTDLLEMRPLIDAVLAHSALAQVTVKAPYANLFRVVVTQGTEVVQDCLLSSNADDRFWLDGIRTGCVNAFLAGSTLSVLLPASPMKYTVSAQALAMGDFWDFMFGAEPLPVSAIGSASVTLNAGKVATGSINLKPSVPVLQIPLDTTYGAVRLSDVGGSCTLDQLAGLGFSCEGDLSALAPPFVAVTGGQAATGIQVTAGAQLLCFYYACPPECPAVCFLPVTVPMSAGVKDSKPALVKLAAPKYVVSAGFVVLDISGNSAKDWQADLWSSTGGDILGDCMFSSGGVAPMSWSYSLCGHTGALQDLVESCPDGLTIDFDLNAYLCIDGVLPSMQAGKIAIPVGQLPASLDIEASQFNGAKHSTAFVENLHPAVGKVTQVKLKFGAGPKDA